MDADSSSAHEEEAFAALMQRLTVSRGDARSLRLAAVTAALLEVGTDGAAAGAPAAASPTRVVAQAVTALEGTLTAAAVDGDDAAAAALADATATQLALLELLAAALPHVRSPAFAARTLPLTARVLRGIAAVAAAARPAAAEARDESAGGGANALLRWTCRAVAQVLRGLPPSADAAVVKPLVEETLLRLLQDRRPKVRREAAAALAEVLLAPGCHGAARRATQQYAHAVLRRAKASPQDRDGLMEVVHFLSVLETCVGALSLGKLLQETMELLAELVQVDSSHAATADFAAVTKVRENTPKISAINAILSTVIHILTDEGHDETRDEQLRALAPRSLASLLQAKPLLVFREGTADHCLLDRGRTLWGRCIMASCARSPPDVTVKLLPLAIRDVVLLSKPSDRGEGEIAVPHELMVGLTQCLRQALPAIAESQSLDAQKCLNDCLTSMALVLDPLYRPTWDVSLRTLALMIQLTFQHVDVQQPVRSLIALHDQVLTDSASQNAVEEAFTSLVQGVGIEACWQWIDLQLPGPDGKLDLDQSWILAKLKSAVASAHPIAPRMSFFQSEILVAARAYYKVAATQPKNRALNKARVVALWALFPYFCNGPSDIETSLPGMVVTCTRAMEDGRYPQLLPIICHGLKNLVSSYESMLNQARIDDSVSGLMQQTSKQVLPALFKVMTTTSQKAAASQNSNQGENSDADPATMRFTMSQDPMVSEAVTAMARMAPKDFLQSLFKKLMHRLLEEVQAEKSDDSNICVYLRLSQSLVASSALELSDISLLYRALKPLLRTDEHSPHVQKRTYKVMFEICRHYHAFISNIKVLDELISLLTETGVTSQISARQMRLKCIEIIVKGFEEASVEQVNTFLKATPEILLCLKDTNAKARATAMELLVAMASKCGVTEILKHVAAALGAQTSHMQSAAVLALSRLIYEFAWDDSTLQSSLPSLLPTVLVLIDANSREVIKSVLGFIRVSVAAMPSDQLEDLLPELVQSLTRYHKPKNRFRAKIKIILKKLVKLFGYDALMPHVAESEAKLLIHMRKISEREERKKIAARTGRDDATDFDAMFESDEEDSEQWGTTASRTTRKSVRSGQTSMSQKTKGSTVTTKLGFQGVRLQSDASGEIVDMLGVKHARQVKFANDTMMEDDSDSDGVLEFDLDGRLVVKDEDDTHQQKVKDAPVHQKKRRRLESNDGKARQGAKASRKNQLGTTYKSAKAGGDVKRKGQKFEPYAFVPLDGRQYSKKNRRNAVEQMSSVVRSGSKRKRSRD